MIGELSRGIRRGATIACALSLLTALVASAQAAEPVDVRTTVSTQVLIDCPRLTPDETAAVEARSRTELLVQQAPVGTLRLGCNDAQLQASWEPGDGSASETERRASDPNAILTDELVTLASVVLERSLARTDEPPPAPSRSPAVDAPAVEVPAAELPPLPPEPPPTQSTPSAGSPEPAPLPRPPNPPPAEPATPARSESAQATENESSHPPSALLLGLGLDVWFAEVAGTAGPLAGVSVPLTTRLAVRASAGLGFGLSAARVISVRHVVIEAGLEVTAQPWLLASLGGGFSSMSFSSSSASPEGTGTSHAPLAFAALRLVPRAAKNRVTLGPVVRFVGKEREVTLDDRVVLTPPQLWGALELEGRFEL